MLPEEELASSLLVALRADFAEREATARQLAELLLDAVAAAIPLTRHQPSEAPLAELETLAQQVDLYSWDGAPGWDVVLSKGLSSREPLPPGPSVLDGLGARRDRTQQRGELKRRAHAEAEKLVSLGREAARFRSAGAGAGAQALDQMPTLPAPGAIVAAHASLLRLVGLACVAPLLSLPEEPSPLPAAGALEDRDLTNAHEEWLARLLNDNPAAAAAPAFRTFFAGLSQTLRAIPALRELSDPEPILGAIATWQPARWSGLRRGAPSQWFETFGPPAPPQESPPERLDRECDAALELLGRLWVAKDLTPAAFTALAALFVARCASAVALWEELALRRVED